MKVILYSLFLATLFLFGCNDDEKEEIIGIAPPINPEIEDATIGAEGGTISIKTETDFNLSSLGIYEDGIEVDHIIVLYDETLGKIPDTVTGDWYKVEHRPKEAYFEIEPNDTGKSRALKLAISRDDAGAYIDVTQAAE